MTIGLMVEGKTEKVFLPFLRSFLERRLAGRMPRIKPHLYDGRIPKEHRLRREVRLLLKDHDAVIALTDVYTGTNDFTNAEDAKAKMRAWVGSEERFHPHAAQHDFEAWLLPYWARIQQVSGYTGGPPQRLPEEVNHHRPPSWHIAEAFHRGSKRGSYSKTRDARTILEGQDLSAAIAACGELRALVNTIVSLSGGIGFEEETD